MQLSFHIFCKLSFAYSANGRPPDFASLQCLDGKADAPSALLPDFRGLVVSYSRQWNMFGPYVMEAIFICVACFLISDVADVVKECEQLQRGFELVSASHISCGSSRDYRDQT